MASLFKRQPSHGNRKVSLGTQELDYLTANTELKDREMLRFHFDNFIAKHPKGRISRKDFRFVETVLWHVIFTVTAISFVETLLKMSILRETIPSLKGESLTCTTWTRTATSASGSSWWSCTSCRTAPPSKIFARFLECKFKLVQFSKAETTSVLSLDSTKMATA